MLMMCPKLTTMQKNNKLFSLLKNLPGVIPRHLHLYSGLFIFHYRFLIVSCLINEILFKDESVTTLCLFLWVDILWV